MSEFTPEEREWAEGPEGEQDVLRYISATPALLSMLYDLDLLPEQHPDPESKEREQIFIITNHWREAQLARSEKGLIDELSALMLKNEGMDVDICAPGNHGGRGEDANRWLVTLMPSDHNNIREFFGNTLAEAIRYATL